MFIDACIVKDILFLFIADHFSYPISSLTLYPHIGNWSCFRNEFLNSTPMVIDHKTTPDEIPSWGVLEFDFTSSARPDMAKGERDKKDGTREREGVREEKKGCGRTKEGRE